MKQKTLHIFKLDKFASPFIELVRREFIGKNHFFITSGDKELYPYKSNSDSDHHYKKGNGILKNIRLLLELHKSDKIILHGLFSKKIILILACMPWLLPKCFWFIWGGDLYSYKTKKTSLKSKWREFLRSIVIKRIGYLVTYIDGDAELARDWYQAKGKQIKSLMYLSNTFSFSEIRTQKENSHRESINILLGNSANPSNNHSEILRKLSPHENIKIYTPLSYGDRKNATKINEEGKALFGNNFIPLNDFMPLEEYKALLEKIDIAIFNHNRQQGMGNIISLLGLGKTVYIRSDVTPWPFFKEKGITLADSIDIKLERLPETILANNSKIIQESFSEAVLIKELELIFNTKV